MSDALTAVLWQKSSKLRGFHLTLLFVVQYYGSTLARVDLHVHGVLQTFRSQPLQVVEGALLTLIHKKTLVSNNDMSDRSAYFSNAVSLFTQS